MIPVVNIGSAVHNVMVLVVVKAGGMTSQKTRAGDWFQTLFTWQLVQPKPWSDQVSLTVVVSVSPGPWWNSVSLAGNAPSLI